MFAAPLDDGGDIVKVVLGLTGNLFFSVLGIGRRPPASILNRAARGTGIGD
jgi:hypothetical protein